MAVFFRHLFWCSFSSHSVFSLVILSTPVTMLKAPKPLSPASSSLLTSGFLPPPTRGLVHWGDSQDLRPSTVISPHPLTLGPVECFSSILASGKTWNHEFPPQRPVSLLYPFSSSFCRTCSQPSQFCLLNTTSVSTSPGLIEVTPPLMRALLPQLLVSSAPCCASHCSPRDLSTTTSDPVALLLRGLHSLPLL